MSDGFYIRQGRNSALDITSGQVISNSQNNSEGALNTAGRLVRVNVLVAGSTGGAAYDAATVAGAAVANQIGAWPNTIGSYLIDMPCVNGIVVIPGTGQTIAVSYD